MSPRRVVLVTIAVVSLSTGWFERAFAQPSPSPRATPAVPAAGKRTRRVRDALSGMALAAFDRANVLFEDNDYGGARAEFERAFDLSGEPRVLYNLAVCDKMVRRYTRAIENLERSLRLGAGRLPADYVTRTNETLLTLAPYVSKISIEADQEDASVLIDGELAGKTPLPAPIAIEVGEHLVSVRKSGYLDVPKRVRVTSGETANATFTLEPAISRSDVTINVSGAPTGARVMILVDGVEVGAAPFRTMMESGPHTIGARAAGLTASPQRVEIQPRQPMTVSLLLESESRLGRLRVRADDNDDVIELDGKDVGRGSFEQQLPAGEHHLRVKRSGTSPRSFEFVIGENETRSMNLSLEKKSGLPTWFWVGGGLLLAGGATVAVVLLTRRTEYEGSAPGTLAPRVIPAAFRFGGSP